MTEKEREIFYKLLLDLLAERPGKRQQSQTERKPDHETISTSINNNLTQQYDAQHIFNEIYNYITTQKSCDIVNS